MRGTTKLITFFSIIIALLCNLNSNAQTPTYQDCLGAIPICEDSVVVNVTHSGMGNYSNEIANVSTCYATEQNSIWFTFTAQSSGLLRFELNPVNNNTDHDWTLFDLTNSTCAALNTSAGASAAMVRSNTWGAFGFNGPTGVSTPNGGSGVCNGPGTTNGPKWNADLPVTAGQRFVLHVTNWSNSGYGFTLDLSSSTASLFDSIPPKMDTIVSPIVCTFFDSLKIRFTENIVCDSTSTSDFQLVGPGGPYTITSVTSNACDAGADYSNEYTVHFTPAVTQVGNYQLRIKSGANYVEDLCGNQSLEDTIGFYFSGAVGFNIVTTEPLCHGMCTGSINVFTTQGSAPFSYSWSNGLSASPNHTNVCAGTYLLTVTDNQGCTKVDTVVVSQPSPLQASVPQPGSVSCPGSTVCDGKATASATGGTPPYNYYWSNNEQTKTAYALCAGNQWVSVTDANGCADSITTYVQVPADIKTTVHKDTVICKTNTANLIAGSTGGTPPYFYQWRRGSASGPIVGSGQAITVAPLDTTTYFAISTDQRGCPGDTASATVMVRPSLGIVFPPKDTICPGEFKTITVTGTGGDGNYTFNWNIGTTGPQIVVSPDSSRWYRVTVTDLCGTPSYTDSVFLQVGGYPDIKAIIKVDDDSICPGEQVTLIASGLGGHNGPDDFTFQWKHTMSHNRVQFVKPVKTTDYVVTITDKCLSKPGVDTLTIYVDDMELPEPKAFPAKNCGPYEALIQFDGFRDGYEYNWYLSDGAVYADYTDSTLTHFFSAPGCYDFKLEAISNFDCPNERNYPCVVDVLETSDAKFIHTPENPTSIKPFVEFRDRSKNASDIIWSIDGKEFVNDTVVGYEFSELDDEYPVTLVAFSPDGCTDTARVDLMFIEELTIYIPTSFTPNNDGVNDEFKVVGEELHNREFDLTVFDRYGHQIFRTRNPDQGWDGKSIGGKPYPIGVYPYVLRYRKRTGEIQIITGHVTISKAGDKVGLE
ncbi:MAG: hypothetical protein Kow0075_12220 [Salibacteraceae bacterium]